ncbi:methyltransferase [Phenylobacterium sp.]|uniref:methyltransferase n=1 Tax=Phenylobacterium sp. TaxID=1871053 RepID=UPI002733E46F|nr:methyltransferase [Phenylobacterium sp.]MDP3659993.1 methyltransferase [Phenylobacterium sp.]
MTYMEKVVQWLRQRLDREPPLADPRELSQALRVLALWRASVVVDAYVRHHGLKVYQGPFEGMEYVREATEGAIAPRLIGSYESELHPHLERLIAADLDCVVDVGCAEGYYAVGLARRMPNAVVYAYDINAAARAACVELAARNGVGDRVVVRELFEPQALAEFEGRRVLLMMDVEGAEDDLLRPDLAPAMAGMDIIVETHDVYRPGVLERITERFATTHDILRLDQEGKGHALPPWLRGAAHLDQLLAVWEWRALATPWLVMTPKRR